MQQPGADQQALIQQQEEVQQRQEELAQQQQALEEQRQLAEQQEAFAEERAELAQDHRQQIAEDQQQLIETAPLPPVVVEGILASAILNPTGSLGRIVRIDPNTGRELRRSPLTTVNVRTITFVNNRLLAIAGENRGNAAIRLVEINTDTLEMVRQGDNDIAPGSLLWANGQNLFAIVNADGDLHMGRFNADMVLQARSAITVHPFASVVFSGDTIITQRSDGTAVLLNTQNMAVR